MMSMCVYTYTCIANSTHVACSWSTKKRLRSSGGRAAKRQSPSVNLLQFIGPSHGNRLACSTLPVAKPNVNETPPCVYLCTHICRITQCHGSGSANTSEAGSSSSLNQEPTRSQSDSPSSSSRYVLRNVWLLQGS